MRAEKTIILGAGVTGLAAGIKTGTPIFEAEDSPGGICRSYLKKGYRFELGGGHWLFGDDSQILDFIQSLSPLKFYQRNAAIFFPKDNLYIPYPLQNHSSLLPQKIVKNYPPPRSPFGHLGGGTLFYRLQQTFCVFVIFDYII